MRTSPTSPRFFDPLTLWADVVLKTGEILVSSSTVIQMRTRRMAEHGLQPTEADIQELRLMSDEKMAAMHESSAAITHQIQSTHDGLMRGAQQWFESVNALMALVASVTPAQAATRGEAFFDATNRAVATVTQLSNAGAELAQQGLKPIHIKTTANVQRLLKK